MLKKRHKLLKTLNFKNLRWRRYWGQPMNFPEATTERFEFWHERLEQFFLTDKVKEEKKAALFLTLIGKERYAILRNLCAPELLNSKNDKEYASIIKNHMYPKPIVMLEI